MKIAEDVAQNGGRWKRIEIVGQENIRMDVQSFFHLCQLKQEMMRVIIVI